MLGGEIGIEEDVTLVFREQADGRKVSRLPTGKVVLIALPHVGEVKDGERWLVRVTHKDTFAIARPLERIAVPPPREPLPPRLAPPDPRPGPVAASAPTAPLVRSAVPAPAAPPAVTAATAVRPARVPAPRPAPAAPESAAPVTAPTEIVGPTDRVALFVDAANMDHACRDAGYFVDYAKVREYFRGRGVLYGGYFHVADFTQDLDSRQMTFLDYLNASGYVVRLKKVKRIVDRETGEERFKANVDAELIIDMLNTADNYDVAFLLSGDSDYERLVDILRSRGKRVYAVSSRGTMSRELSFLADKPVYYIEDLRAQLERDDRVPTP